MKSFKDLREECGCEKEDRKSKKKKTVEVMPQVKDGAGKLMGVKEEKLAEVAPPGAKAERMVKHIKKSYAKDGKLTDKEKSIAYATAWKHKNKMKENYDKGEYDYEGDMAKTQLKGVIRNAQELHDLLQPADNLPEWVQSKITLAADYIQTASDYMKSK